MRKQYGEHTNFVGFTVFTDLFTDLGLDVEDGTGMFALEVKAVDFPEGEDWGCDFCGGPSVAVYEVDAVAQLGDAGYNTMYCQKCAVVAANSFEIDEWVSPENRARRIAALKDAGLI